MSKALLKSKAMRCTYGPVSRLLEIILRRSVRTAGVDPEGLKANWSLTERSDEGAGEERQG